MFPPTPPSSSISSSETTRTRPTKKYPKARTNTTPSVWIPHRHLNTVARPQNQSPGDASRTRISSFGFTFTLFSNQLYVRLVDPNKRVMQ
ncbi:Protein of unknown function [Pyronema omphalodes CBS 100304]|uniref:Uncharacterized protein n=1 Tax=Pyronema omphalodes (strain CBS 100304) TaxID=1076935 RepID=U4LTM7_PYROM|nr:Protein of unknown function [Pyronema omphalodes CBS 100304]